MCQAMSDGLRSMSRNMRCETRHTSDSHVARSCKTSSSAEWSVAFFDRCIASAVLGKLNGQRRSCQQRWWWCDDVSVSTMCQCRA